MRILITGGRGQLGRALTKVLSGHVVSSFDLPETDITDIRQLRSAIMGYDPDLVVHCAAFTDVEACARDPETAYKVNGMGTYNVARTCRLIGAAMVHISTNEVFDGIDPEGYEEWRAPNPINSYGRSKALAEFHVRNLLTRYYIVRTAWLFAPGGNNFVHAIIQRAKTKGSLAVVVDEIGNPTYVLDLARAIERLIETNNYGVYHLTNSGSCSRFVFANEILRATGMDGVTNKPILGRDYRRASTPPPFGSLINVTAKMMGITLRPWHEALHEFVHGHYR